MVDAREIVERARSLLSEGLGIDLRRTPVHIAFEDGALIVEGELEDVSVKKLALEGLIEIPGVDGIADRLCVRPAVPMDDSQIREHVRDALREDLAFSDLALYEVVNGERILTRPAPETAYGEITVAVDDGVVTLDGDVPGLGRKRLAGVLAWWVPGSRDVINGLGVTPREEDSDDGITDAVRAALEKDPFVDASQIRVHTRDREVSLEGYVSSDAECDMAEFDAWYVFGVDRVVNRIEVQG